MRKLLVSGLALGSDPKIATCSACNYDMSWLFKNPSTLLWADKIILTPEILESIKRSKYPSGSENLGKAISLIFERLEDNKLIEVKKASDVISEQIKKDIYKQIEIDEQFLLNHHKEIVQIGNREEVPGQIIVNEHEYCTPSLWTMYASFILAKEWEADILFSQKNVKYFERALQSNFQTAEKGVAKQSAFNDIFTSKLPEQELLPIILFDAKLCNSCAQISLCSSDVFKKVEINISNIMDWRSYDEVEELRLTINQIAKYADDRNITTEELHKAFKDEERKINKKIKSVFPKVERWSNMITAASIPAVVAGVSMGSVGLSTLGAGAAGVATAVNKYIEIMKSKYRWVGHKIEK